MLSILSLLVAWNHHYADNHKWRVEKRVETGRERTGRDIEGWQEGARETASWFEWSFATWLEILSNLRLRITWQQRIQPAADRSREWINYDSNTNVFANHVGIQQTDDKERWKNLYATCIHLLLFQTTPRGDPKNSSLLLLFALAISSSRKRLSKRVPLWSLGNNPSQRSSSIIFWSRIRSILGRRGGRCLEPTSRTWLETLVSSRLYQARAKEARAWNARPCGS